MLRVTLCEYELSRARAAVHGTDTTRAGMATSLYLRQKLSSVCGGHNPTAFALCVYSSQCSFTPAEARRIVAGTREAISNFGYAPVIRVSNASELAETLERYCRASQTRYAVEAAAELAAAEARLNDRFREDNGLDVCAPCSAQRGFPCFSHRRDNGHACKSNGGKANCAVTHCALCASVSSV